MLPLDGSHDKRTYAGILLGVRDGYEEEHGEECMMICTGMMSCMDNCESYKTPHVGACIYGQYVLSCAILSHIRVDHAHMLTVSGNDYTRAERMFDTI